jgi:glycosyltransferase involved in cell wall biosynthesis
VRAGGDGPVREAKEGDVTVAFYSPLPPARTGVADYAAALLAGLREYGDVALERGDVPLYQLGNNTLHAAIYRRALERPGVVVLHDAVLHHFLLGQLDEPRYIEEVVYNYGEWARGLARDLWRGRAASGADNRYFAYPMLRRVVERSRAVVVHNPAAARIVREHVPGARVEEIPHLFAPPALPSEAEILRYRQRLRVGPELFLFGVFGYLRESKRLVTVLEAFAEARASTGRMALLVAGEFVSSDLERAAAPLLRAAGIVRLLHLPEREFWMAASAVDACINLRYPAAGETSGIAIRLMGMGKPVMLTDAAECARFPEDSCIRIPAGATERGSLRDHMVLLTSMNEVARSIGLRGAGHVWAHHRVNDVSRRYWQLLCDVGT